MRVAAVTALGLLGACASRRALLQALGDLDATVRREAVHVLSALYRRGGEDPDEHALPESSRVKVCRSNPRATER